MQTRVVRTEVTELLSMNTVILGPRTSEVPQWRQLYSILLAPAEEISLLISGLSQVHLGK